MAKRSGPAWDNARYVDLFLTILAVQGISVDYDKVATAFNISKPALHQVMFKLRKRAGELNIPGALTTGTMGKSSSRGGVKNGAAAKPSSKAKGKGKQKYESGSDDDDEEEERVKFEDDRFEMDMRSSATASPVRELSAAPWTPKRVEPSSPLTPGPIDTPTPVRMSTPKNIQGRVSKSRSTPRRTPKVDYKRLADAAIISSGESGNEEFAIKQTIEYAEIIGSSDSDFKL